MTSYNKSPPREGADSCLSTPKRGGRTLWRGGAGGRVGAGGRSCAALRLSEGEQLAGADRRELPTCGVAAERCEGRGVLLHAHRQLAVVGSAQRDHRPVDYVEPGL